MIAAGYARTYTDFWTGDTGAKMAALDDEGVRSMAHFLFSGPNVSPFGLYYKPFETIVLEFKRPAPGQVKKAELQVSGWLEKLAALEFAWTDDATGFVFVKEMCAMQFRPLPVKPTNLVIKSARRWYSTLARNPFLGPWFDRYDIDLHLNDPFAFPGSETARREWMERGPVQQELMDVERRREPEPLPKLPRPKPEPPCDEEDFASWWSAYPAHRRSAKKQCLAIWQRKKIPKSQLEAVLAKLEEQKASRAWRKEGGQFIPLSKTYLNGERWDDEVAHGAASLNQVNQATADTLQELILEDDKHGRWEERN